MANEVMVLLRATANAVRIALAGLDDWGLAGTRPDQYHADLVADAAALGVLRSAGVGVLSEESGFEHPDRDVVVVVDPLDGSTNAHRRVPWFATSLCAVVEGVPCAALVENLASGTRFEATVGGGAFVDGRQMSSRPTVSLSEAMVALSGLPPRHLGWNQFRCLGAVALDLCAVAGGVLDGYVDCSSDAHGIWDYAGGALVCAEVGIEVRDAFGRDLYTLDHAMRRTPVAAGVGMIEDLVAARRSF